MSNPELFYSNALILIRVRPLEAIPDASIALDMCIGPFPATLHGPTKPLYGIERECPAVHGVEIWHENNLVVAQISAGRGNGNGNGNVGDNNGNGNSGNNNGNWNTGNG